MKRWTDLILIALFVVVQLILGETRTPDSVKPSPLLLVVILAQVYKSTKPGMLVNVDQNTAHLPLDKTLQQYASLIVLMHLFMLVKAGY